MLSFEVNTAVVTNVPQDWADLLKPEYKGQVALAGDPRTSSQAIQAVHAAALANGGSLDNAQPGLDFFKQLNDAGNFMPVIATSATIAAGETPISIRWTYNALANRDATAASGGPAIEVVVPKSVRFAGVYVRAISAYAPHPNAAKLWKEFLFSDEGQNLWLKGYCDPIRYRGSRRPERRPGRAARQAAGRRPGPSSRRSRSSTPPRRSSPTKWDAVVGANVQ